MSEYYIDYHCNRCNRGFVTETYIKIKEGDLLPIGYEHAVHQCYQGVGDPVLGIGYPVCMRLVKPKKKVKR